MPVSSEVSISGPFTPNGVTVDFPFSFKAISTAEVVALDQNGAAIPTALYSVELDSDEGGTLSFSVAPALADYTAIYVASEPSLTQPSDFDNTGPSFNPASLTRALDRAAIRDLKQQREIDRAFRFPFGETSTAIPSASDRASQFLVFDADGNPQVSSGTGADSGLRSDMASSEAGKGVDLVAGAARSFDTLAAMLAHPAASAPVDTIWRAATYTYKVAASGASDHDLTTSGGVKLYVVAPDGVWVESLGAVGDDATDNTVAIEKAIAASERIGHKTVRAGFGTFRSGALTYPTSQFKMIGMGGPTNQDGIAATELKCATAGITLLSPANPAASVLSNLSLIGINFRGASSNDVTSTLFTVLDRNHFGFEFSGVGFVDAYVGAYLGAGLLSSQRGFNFEGHDIHVWNCANVGFVGPGSVSSIYRLCRCGKVPTGPTVNITAISSANPAVITTAAAHGLQTGDVVWVDDVVGFTQSGVHSVINQRPLIVTRISDTQVSIPGISGAVATAYTSGGTIRKSAVGFVFRGSNDLVENFDTSAAQSTTGSVQVVGGQETSLDFTGNASGLGCVISFSSPHFEGCSIQYYNCTGARFHMHAPDFQPNGLAVIPVKISYIAEVNSIKHPKFGAGSNGGSYVDKIQVNSRAPRAGLLQITPVSTSDIPDVGGRADDGYVHYDIGDRVVTAELAAATSIPNSTETQVANFTEVLDQFGDFAAGVWTCPATGPYMHTLSVDWATAAVVGAQYLARVKVAGVNKGVDRRAASTTNALTNNIVLTRRFTKGQTVTYHVSQNSGAAADLTAGTTRVEVVKL